VTHIEQLLLRCVLNGGEIVEKKIMIDRKRNHLRHLRNRNKPWKMQKKRPSSAQRQTD